MSTCIGEGCLLCSVRRLISHKPLIETPQIILYQSAGFPHFVKCTQNVSVTSFFDRSEEPLTLGQWHDLHVSRTAKNGILQVDKQKVVEGMAEVRTHLSLSMVDVDQTMVFHWHWLKKKKVA